MEGLLSDILSAQTLVAGERLRGFGSAEGVDDGRIFSASRMMGHDLSGGRTIVRRPAWNLARTIVLSFENRLYVREREIRMFMACPCKG